MGIIKLSSSASLDLPTRLQQFADLDNYVLIKPKGNNQDDSYNINSALSDLKGAGKGLLLLHGDFNIQSPIITDGCSNIKIAGTGRGTTRLYGYGTNFSVFQGFGSVGSEIKDFELSNLSVIGTGLVDAAYSSNTKGLYMTCLFRALFKNLYFYDIPATGLGADFLVDSTFEAIVAEKCGRQYPNPPNGALGANGIGIGTGHYEYETVTVSDCHAINCGDNGIMWEQQANTTKGAIVGSGYMKVINSTARGCKTGFRESSNHFVEFTSCHSFNNDLYGFELATGFSSPQQIKPLGDKIIGCHAIGNGSHGIYVNQSDSVGGFDFSHNFINQNGGYGIQSDVALNNSQVKDNQLISNTSGALSIPTSTNLTTTPNIVA